MAEYADSCTAAFSTVQYFLFIQILNESDKAGAGDKAGTMDIDLPPTDGFGTTLGDYGMFTCVLARLHCTNDQALRRCCCNLFLYCFTSQKTTLSNCTKVTLLSVDSNFNDLRLLLLRFVSVL